MMTIAGIATALLSAETQTTDLAKYTVPDGWKREEKSADLGEPHAGGSEERNLVPVACLVEHGVNRESRHRLLDRMGNARPQEFRSARSRTPRRPRSARLAGESGHGFRHAEFRQAPGLPAHLFVGRETDYVHGHHQSAGYNKFAVSAADIIGNWESAGGAGVQYYDVYTGNNAGFACASSTNSFAFRPDGTYTSVYKGVHNAQDGRGTIFSGETFTGKFAVSNWEMSLTNRFKGASHTFSAMFEAVKGGRILHLYRGNVEDFHLFQRR